VEVVHPWALPADERPVGDRRGKRLDDEHLDALPEGGGAGEEAPLGLVGRLPVENRVEAGDRGDLLVVERLMYFRLGCRRVLFQVFEPYERTEYKDRQYNPADRERARHQRLRVVVKMFANPPETLTSSSSFR